MFEKKFPMPSKKEGMMVGFGVAVGLADDLELVVGLYVGIGVALTVAVGLGVTVGFSVGVALTDGLGVAVGEGLAVAVGVAVGLSVTVGLGEAVGVAVGVGVDDPPLGAVTALAFNVTAVCASTLPFSFAPVFSTIAVWDNMIPLTSEVVPSVACPATCQKMFLAWAPPLSVIMAPLPTSRFCPIWNIQTSFEPPERITPVGIVTPVPHL